MPEWDNWVKPWNSEQCESVYVFGDEKLSIRKLSVISGVNTHYLRQYSKNGDWVNKRKQVKQEETQTILQADGDLGTQKLLEKHKVLSEEMRAIAEEHYQASREVRLKAQAFFKEIDPVNEKKISPVLISAWNGVLKDAIANEREAKGLKYWIDLNASIGKVLSEGFKISD